MASIFKKERRKNSPWYIDYFDANGIRRRVKGCADRTVTEQIARKLESEVELRRRGVIDSKSDGYRDAERKPLTAHLDDFRAALVAKGNTGKHVELFVGRARRVIETAGLVRLSELSSSRIQGALADLRGQGKSLATC